MKRKSVNAKLNKLENFENYKNKRRQRRLNRIVKDLHTPKYHQRVVKPRMKDEYFDWGEYE